MRDSTSSATSIGLSEKSIQRLLGFGDIFFSILSPFASLLMRSWLGYSAALPLSFIIYAAASSLATICLIWSLRASRAAWRYFSAPDAVRAAEAICIGIAIGTLLGFTHDRLDTVPRAVPPIQAILQMGAFIATRRFAQTFLLASPQRNQRPSAVLIIGCNATAFTYVRAIEALSHGTLEVVGLLTNDPFMIGHSIRGKKIVGAIGQVADVIATFQIHGREISRLAVALPERDLSLQETRLIENVASERSLSLTNIHAIFSKTVTAEVDNEIYTPTEVLGIYGLSKRLLDIAVASILVILTAPIMVAVALAVAIDVGFPLIFWQDRLGRGGRSFTAYKFRTMRNPLDKAGRRVPDEFRVSAIGRFLRRSRLDELPQLWNILNVDMSFVGPRPLLPIDQPMEMTRRLSVQPGLTGWAQVNGGILLDPEEKRVLDLWYVGHANLWLDIRILFLTVRIVLTGDRPGAEAIAHARRWLREREHAIDVAEGPMAAPHQPTWKSPLSKDLPHDWSEQGQFLGFADGSQ